jgi:hypothetical protein
MLCGLPPWQVESYMNAKIKRNPLVAQSCAEYLGYFVAGGWASRHWHGGQHSGEHVIWHACASYKPTR